MDVIKKIMQVAKVPTQDQTLEEETPLSSITSEINIIKVFGLFPMYNQPLEGNRIVFYLKYSFNMLLTLLFITSIWMNIFVNFSESAEVIETLYFGLTETTFVAKLINMHLRYKTFQQLAKYLEDPAFNNYSQEQHAFIKQGLWIVRIFARVFRGAVSTTIAFFMIVPFLNDTDNMLIIPTWFPAAAEKYQFMCYLFQLWGIILNGYAHSSMDCIVTGLIMTGSAQFEILKSNLNNLRRGLRMPQSEKERTMQEDYVLRKMRGYVHHHVMTIKYAYEIENMFSFVQFVQFLASSIIICVTGFQIIVTPFTDMKFLMLVLYFTCNLIQVVMCCWFGHDIMTKSEGVGEACYMSDWYVCGTRVARTIFIIMERSKRPVTLTAGKFFDLTLQTLMQVLKTSYSYLALLRRMNEVERL